LLQRVYSILSKPKAERLDYIFLRHRSNLPNAHVQARLR
jgi:hypothetical protein